MCPLTNISQCALTENDNDVILLIYNPIIRSLPKKTVRFPVKEANIEIFDGTSNEKLLVEFVPIPQFVKDIPGRDSESQYDVVFEATNIPPLGTDSFKTEFDYNQLRKFQKNLPKTFCRP